MPAAKVPAAPPTTPPATDAVTFFVMPFGLTIVPAISGAPSAVDASSAMRAPLLRVCCRRDSSDGGERTRRGDVLQRADQRVDVGFGGAEADARAHGAGQLR